MPCGLHRPTSCEGILVCLGIPSSNPSSTFSPMLVFIGDYFFYLVMTWTQPSSKKDFMWLKKINTLQTEQEKLKQNLKLVKILRGEWVFPLSVFPFLPLPCFLCHSSHRRRELI
jgi:hypothetical protein